MKGNGDGESVRSKGEVGVSNTDAGEPTRSMDEEGHPQVFRAGQVVAGRFEVIRKLGSGGMGQVYLAYDKKLLESVALKTLHPILADDPQFVKRFLAEIKVTRKVFHPNICRTFELIEHQQGDAVVSCLTMEHLTGKSLASMIDRNRPLGLDQALALLTPIADAVASLHASGIIHRDLKPSNVIVVPRPGIEPRVVVTDFGLAKSVTDSSDGGLSPSGAGGVGSPYFMAPELFEGDDPSPASDIYALGLILDEMVTRSKGFHYTTLKDLCEAKLAGPIPPAQRSNGLPERWQHAILRSLDSDPNVRHRDCTELLEDLGANASRTRHALSTAMGGLRNPGGLLDCVAVMPFVDLDPRQGNVYFRDGLAEELIHLLSQIQDVRVVARASVYELQETPMNVSEIGRTLGATHIIIGKIWKSGNLLKVSVQFVEIAGKFNLWSRQFDCPIADVLHLQETIAGETVKVVISKLRPSGQIPQLNPPTSSNDAYPIYLHGLFQFNRQTAASLAHAARLFKRATKEDPDFARAYGGLAECYCTQEWYGVRPAPEIMPRAKEMAARAIEIDPFLASPHCCLGLICARYEWDWERAAEHFEQAIALGPGTARPYFAYALDYLTPLGRLDEALRYIRTALEFDPLSPIYHSALGGCLYRMRIYEESERSLRHALKMSPRFYHLHWSLARTLEQLGRYDEAVQEYLRARSRNHDNQQIYAELGHCYGKMDLGEQAATVLDDLLAIGARKYISPLCVGFVHLGLSHTSDCLNFIAAAAEQRAGPLIWMRIDARFDGLRDNLRFKTIFEGMRIPPSKIQANSAEPQTE